MAETTHTPPDSLDELSEPQCEALTWLARLPGAAADDPETIPEEHRAQTWSALARRSLVERTDRGGVRMLATGRMLTGLDRPETMPETAREDEPAAPEAEQAAVEQGPEQAADEPDPGADGDEPASAPPSGTEVTFETLRPGQTGADARGGWRVLGPPEHLHGRYEGWVRVAVMRGEDPEYPASGHRDYLRGPAGDAVAVD